MQALTKSIPHKRISCSPPRNCGGPSTTCKRPNIAAMAAAKDLVVVGSLNCDLVLPVKRVPQPGETLAADGMDTVPGGKGANQAAGGAKLGHPTHFVGQIGTDANASLLRASLQEAGAKLEHLREVPGPSGTAIIILQSNGENSIIIVGGANQAEWILSDAAKAEVSKAGAVLLQREIPEHVNVEVAKLAKAANVPVYMDAGGMEGPLDPQILACLTLLSPNETELNRLTNMPTENEEQIEAAAKMLQGMGVEAVLVKLGAEGSLFLPGKGQPPIRQRAIKADKVLDTTGAGDCFTAAYTVAILEGMDTKAALQFASAAGSICVQRAGAMPSMPSRADVEALLASTK
ncbi:Ribokinase-like protein [Dunaliella salina]|uniref:Ribokinase n=1 Tax=Dunaliella salina TaxID=3046 RepID=A0ABQ7GE00_DUNSA|nr:Ribokinase-like protein [Dunaliella salina]|eukprot:KAF5832813.1 Ribokinase-like protein [Dunaliella salina]